MCVSWNNNALVIVISNVHGPIPATSVKRWNLQNKNYINIDRSHCITLYNKHMSDVDSLDALVSVY